MTEEDLGEPEGYYYTSEKRKRTKLGEIDFDWGLTIET